MAHSAANGLHDDPSPDAGFTLIESIVSLLLLTMVLGAVATEVVSSLHNSLLARQVSQAGDVLMEQSEIAQHLPYASVAMGTGDLTGDSRIISGSVNLGSMTEPVYATSTGAVAPHITTETRQGTRYQVARYVTTPSSACDCRRLTTFVTWTAYGESHSRSTSTIVGDVNRGNTSSYTWAATNATTQFSVSRSGTLVLPVSLLNFGSPDSWTLTVDPSGPSWVSTVGWYVDENGDGIWQSGSETTRLDSAFAGTGITGTIPSGDASHALAVFSVPSSATTGSFTVQLVATPSNSTGTAQAVTFVVNVS